MLTQSPAFSAFVDQVAEILSRTGEVPFPCPEIAERLGALVTDSRWLPAEWRAPSAESYRRQCLYQAPDSSFSIGCFVWSPGQRTPIHDHRSWGVIGVLEGSITSETFVRNDISLTGTPQALMPAGLTAWVHPQIGDIHRIGGGPQGGISVHVYGCAFDVVCVNLYEDA